MDGGTQGPNKRMNKQKHKRNKRMTKKAKQAKAEVVPSSSSVKVKLS